VVQENDEPHYQELETAKHQALLVAKDVKEFERLEAEQNRLKKFRPWMQHSFGEQARPIVFHPQLLANFNTIEEMGRKFLEALDA
jgi:hypothetical protein